MGGIIHVHTELGGKIYFKKPHQISKKGKKVMPLKTQTIKSWLPYNSYSKTAALLEFLVRKPLSSLPRNCSEES